MTHESPDEIWSGLWSTSLSGQHLTGCCNTQLTGLGIITRKHLKTVESIYKKLRKNPIYRNEASRNRHMQTLNPFL